jgi:hypothetical protein
MSHQVNPPQTTILQILMGTWIARALGAVVRLDVADHLKYGPRTAHEIAMAAGAEASTLERTLIALSTVGVFQHRSDARWELTPLGACLCSDVPGSMRDVVFCETDHLHHATWGRFTEAVRTGKPQTQEAVGSSWWEYYEQNPDEGAAFSRAMANLSSMAIAPVVAAYDFSEAKVVADIGGAHGALLAAILRKHAGARGILFDLPHVVAGADATLGDTRARVECLGGDFLKDMIPAADVYLLKHVLHDWDDASSVSILARIRAAMKASSRVLVIEMVIPEQVVPGPAPLMDLNMMLIGGMERTAAQYNALFAQAGFGLTRSITTPSPFGIIEAKPV